MRPAFAALMVLAFVAVLASLPRALIAGTLPNIGGTWYAYGDRWKACHINQSGSSVTLRNEQGNSAHGNFVANNPMRLNTHWGAFSGGQVFGTISNDLRRIDWSNGSYWERGPGSYSSGSYGSGYQVGSSSSTPTPQPTPTPARLNVSARVTGNGESPIYVYGASLSNGYGRSFQQCVSFRNISNKEATDIDFSFVVTRYSGPVEADFGWADRGKFTPPIAIDDHCWKAALWPDHVVRLMAVETVRVKEVTFADGTTWKAGMPFIRAYGNTGEPLPRPIIEQPATPTPLQEHTP